jgi:hypothetical protein
MPIVWNCVQDIPQRVRGTTIKRQTQHKKPREWGKWDNKAETPHHAGSPSEKPQRILQKHIERSREQNRKYKHHGTDGNENTA